MKNTFLLTILLIFSSQAFSEAFLSIGATTPFKHRQDTYVQDSDEFMYLVSLNGINLGENSQYKDVIGFSITYGWGEYTHDKRLFTHKKSQLLGLGFNFPINDSFYIHAGGNILWTDTEFSTDDHPNVRKDDSETLTGYQFAVGTELSDYFAVELGYNETLDAATFQIGYCWHKCQ